MLVLNLDQKETLLWALFRYRDLIMDNIKDTYTKGLDTTLENQIIDSIDSAFLLIMQAEVDTDIPNVPKVCFSVTSGSGSGTVGHV